MLVHHVTIAPCGRPRLCLIGRQFVHLAGCFIYQRPKGIKGQAMRRQQL